MKKLLYVFIGIFSLVLLTGCQSINLDEEISNLDLTGVDNLMIVAHPDDETLWGGAHLIRDNYLVVCVTCGTNSARVEEIKEVLKITDDKLLMLGYPDKVFGQRSDWKNEKEDIYKDIEKIAKLKKWNLIVTHNTEGEYGHNHHIMTNEITTSVYNDLKIDSELYYFGKYYSKKKMDKLLELPEEIKSNELTKKEELLKIYKTQKDTVEKFKHMNRYEDWIKQD